MALDFRSQTNAVPGIRNNNPGNLRPGDNWKGMVGVSSQNFIIFSNMTYGIRALATDLSTKYFSGYNTIRKIINRYAPPSENNTTAYINAVSASVGVNPDTVLSMDRATLKKMVKAVMMHELGDQYYQMIPDSAVDDGLNAMSPEVVRKIAGF